MSSHGESTATLLARMMHLDGTCLAVSQQRGLCTPHRHDSVRAKETDHWLLRELSILGIILTGIL